MAGAPTAIAASRRITTVEAVAAGSRRSRSHASRHGPRPWMARAGPVAAASGELSAEAVRLLIGWRTFAHRGTSGSAAAQPEVGDVVVLGARAVDGVVDAAGVEQRHALRLDGSDRGVPHDLQIGLVPEQRRGVLVGAGQRPVDQRI